MINLPYHPWDRNLYGLYKCDFKKYFVPLCSKRVAGSVPRGFQNCIAFLLYVQESVHKQRIGLKGICWCTMVWKTFWRSIHVFIGPSVFMSSYTKIIEIISCSQDLIMSSKVLVYEFPWIVSPMHSEQQLFTLLNRHLSLYLK